jgi:glycerol-3-phosphate cytidylyltransferase
MIGFSLSEYPNSISSYFLSLDDKSSTLAPYLDESQIMKKVITYGTYDLLHRGHIHLLRRARELGDYLVVALSSDSFNAIKEKKACHPFEERKLVLEAIRYVDLVIPEHTWEQKRDDVIEHQIDVFVMGDDWKGKFDFLSPLCEVVYLERTKGISTTGIKNELSGNGQA